ncbi:MAG: electron transporter [bacterium]|nr:MAG: electron transporter [bacterium]
MKIPTREIYWNVPNHLPMYVGEAVLFLLLGYGIYQIISVVRKGSGSIPLAPLIVRSRQMFNNVWAHKKIRAETGGTGHMVFFYGFIVLFIGTCLIFLQELTGLHFLEGTLYIWYSLTLDVFGFAALIALSVALVNRFTKPRLRGYAKDAFITFLLWLIIFTGFMLEGARLAAAQPEWAGWSPVGLMFGMPLKGIDQRILLMGHHFIWWFHLTISFLFIAFLPYTRLLHVAAGTLNILTKTLPPVIKIETPDLEKAENFGCTKPLELAAKDLLDGFACMACGRCDDVCPASLTGKPLFPRSVIMTIHDRALWYRERFLIESSERKMGLAPPITDDMLWACTTCAACHNACPVYVEPINKIVDMRRALVMREGRYPAEITAFFKNEETNANPWGFSWEKRTEWAAGLNVPIAADKKEFEYLFWVGCAGSYDMRYKKVSAALANLLNRARVDYAILGAEEKCSGDPLRRLGNEYQFQILAEENIEKFKKYNVSKIVTACPHCYNIFKNEYPDLGLEAEVIHHSQLIEELLNNGKLPKPAASSEKSEKIVYHDSCYLGRYNSVFDSPRELVGNGNNRLEADRKFYKSFCCGAGGGRMWMEEKIGQRINIARANELMAANPTVIATACPFCMTMITDGVKAGSAKTDVPVKDVCEILLERLPDS